MFKNIFYKFSICIMESINNINQNNVQFNGALTQEIAKNFANKGNIGEGASIACDFFGKAVIVPIVVMAASDEPKEKKEFSALKNPVAALIQLSMEVPILALGSKLIGSLADKDVFDDKEQFKQGFSYNEKKCREIFTDTFEKAKDLNESQKALIKSVKEKGYTSNLADDLVESVKTIDAPLQDEILSSFKTFENARNNKYHLANRICFVAALMLTPVLCAIENKVHPKIMNKIYKLRGKNNKPNMIKMPDLKEFKEKAAESGVL